MQILGQMQMTVDLTVEMLPTGKSSIRDNGLEAPLMIEWEWGAVEAFWDQSTSID